MCPSGGGGGREGKKHMLIWSWNLPEDICLDIFTRLPTKSVMRCRCVCKSWRTMTSYSNTSFINMHLVRSSSPHRQNPDIVFRDCRSWDVPRFTFSIVENFCASNQALQPLLMPLSLTSLCLVGSCNGLLCFANFTHPFRYVYLYNPCTGETTQFPLPSSSRCEGGFLGFGHDPILDEYKVVTINHERVGEVWTLGSDLWRTTIDVPFMRTGYMDHSNYVSLDGALHWISQEENALTFGIGSFCIASEEFQFIPLPIQVSKDSVEFMGGHLVIGTLQGRISVVKLVGFDFDQVEVWATNNHRIQGGWQKQFRMKANLLCQMCIFRNWDILLDNEDRIAPRDLGRLELIAEGTNLGLESIVKITNAFVHVGTLVSPLRGSQANCYLQFF